MIQFSLDVWLQDKSRKICTRDGRPVRIVCWDRLGRYPIVACIKDSDNYEYVETYKIDGSIRSLNYEDRNDLFFADEEDELTEFEKKVLEISGKNYNYVPSIKVDAQILLDLARKELEANYYTKVLDDGVVFKSDLHDRDMQGAYELGKQDALKDLPKWRRDCFHNITSAVDGRLYCNGYYIDINELEKLPKEE